MRFGRPLHRAFSPAVSVIAIVLALALAGAPRAIAGNPEILDPTPPPDTWDKLGEARILRVLRIAPFNFTLAAGDSEWDWQPRVLSETSDVPSGWQDDLVDQLSGSEEFAWRDEKFPFARGRMLSPDLFIDMLVGSDTLRVTLDLRRDEVGVLPLLPHTWINVGEQHDRILELAQKLFPADTGLAGLAARGREVLLEARPSSMLVKAAAEPGGVDAPDTPGLADGPPVLVEAPPARYPSGARYLRREGRVILCLFVNTEGRVAVIEVRHNVRGFTAAAIDAASGYRFRPATRNGVPVAVWVQVPINFTLR